MLVLNPCLMLNPYDETRCRKIVEEKFLPAILKKFGTSSHLLYDKVTSKVAANLDLEVRSKFNPRGRCSISIVPCGIFYYLDYILPNDDEIVVDVGCGENLFKDIIPNLYGINPDGDFCDEHGSFDIEGKFAKKYHRQFGAVMAINSLHFTSLLNFSTTVNLFSTIVRPGGRGYLGINAARMVSRTSKDELNELFGNTKPSPKQLEEYFDQEIKKLNLKFLVVDNLIRVAYDESIDGNVRLVFEV